MSTYRLKEKKDYLGSGGQGMIMTKDQFKDMLNMVKANVQFTPIKNESSPGNGSVLSNGKNSATANITGTSSDNYTNVLGAIPDGCVKLIADASSWSEEVTELINADKAVGLPYIDKDQFGGVFEMDGNHKLVYGGFFSTTINLNAFGVIFMDIMTPMPEDKPSKLKPIQIKQYNTKIKNEVLEPLIKQMLRYHKAGLVHRDIKHLNAMMHTPKAEATLIDFGLAVSVKDQTARNTKLWTYGYPVGTMEFLSPWYYMLHAIYPTAPARTTTHTYAGKKDPDPFAFVSGAIDNLDKNCKGITSDNLPPTWVLRRLKCFKFFENRHGFIGDKVAFFTLLAEMNMKEYLETTRYTSAAPPNAAQDVEMFMKMNDWFALAITIQKLYDVELPLYKESLLQKMLCCFGRGRNFSYEVNRISGETPKADWDKKTLAELDTFVKLKSDIMPPMFGGVMKAGKAHSLRKILGKNRKVYKKKGMGNVLYVKVRGEEMTMKQALSLEIKKSKTEANKTRKVRQQRQRQ